MFRFYDCLIARLYELQLQAVFVGIRLCNKNTFEAFLIQLKAVQSV